MGLNCFAIFFVLVFFITPIISASSESKEQKIVDKSGGVNNPSKTHDKTAVTTSDEIPDKWEHDADVQHLVKDAKELADISVGFWHAFVASISVIIVSEIGDKTFFIAAIMAMRNTRITVFAGAITALGLMTVLSACLGWATQIIPRAVTFYASTILFALFGLKMLREGYYMSPSEGQEELEEAQEEIRRREEKRAAGVVPDIEAGGVMRPNAQASFVRQFIRFFGEIYLESFTLTFLAEWGDRSQITTIILAARENVTGVTLGGIIGHSICTGMAVIGGRMIAQRISVRTVTLIGGVVFILFALSALVMNPE